MKFLLSLLMVAVLATQLQAQSVAYVYTFSPVSTDSNPFAAMMQNMDKANGAGPGSPSAYKQASAWVKQQMPGYSLGQVASQTTHATTGGPTSFTVTSVFKYQLVWDGVTGLPPNWYGFPNFPIQIMPLDPPGFEDDLKSKGGIKFTLTLEECTDEKAFNAALKKAIEKAKR